MRLLASVPVYSPQERLPYNLLGVSLAGEYPDTRLTVTGSRAGPDVAFTMEFGLWNDDFGEIIDERQRLGPERIADEIYTFVMEEIGIRS
jgi:hypothetical protein